MNAITARLTAAEKAYAAALAAYYAAPGYTAADLAAPDNAVRAAYAELTAARAAAGAQ